VLIVASWARCSRAGGNDIDVTQLRIGVGFRF
jgi:hypothetical protein